jgi:curved DNA-binding protein CbpA
LRKDASLRGLGFFGLPQTASEQELRYSYFALAKRLHPDIAGAEKTDEFKHVHDEYEHAKYELQRRAGTLRGAPQGFASSRSPTGAHNQGKHGHSWKESAQNPYGPDMTPSIDPRVEMHARAIVLGVVASFAFIVVELSSASCGQRISYKPFWLSSKGSWARRFETKFGHRGMMKDYDAESALKRAGKLAPRPAQETKQLEVSSFYADRIAKLRDSKSVQNARGETQEKSPQKSDAPDKRPGITEIKAKLLKAAEAANAAAAARRATPGTAPTSCQVQDSYWDIRTTVGGASRAPKNAPSASIRSDACEPLEFHYGLKRRPTFNYKV